jgi:2-methylcitrate dehydratase PrpD
MAADRLPGGDPPAREVTRDIIRRTRGYRWAGLPGPVIELARQCVLDYFAVALAGSREPVVNILIEDAMDRGASGTASLVGRGERLELYEAALVNGAAAHALDYDDFNEAASGHVSSPILSALVPLAERRAASGAALIEAFVVALETMGRLGRLVQPGHGRRGFHTTATLGCIAAAAGAAAMMDLDEERTAHAYGIAATSAAGLVASFGTMAKPLHAGRAAMSGLQAARLAARAVTGRTDVLEAARGFASAHGDGLDAVAALADPPHGFHLFSQIFKYHASCGPTHSAIEAALRVRARNPDADAIERVIVRTGPAASVCNIPSPRTALELKFSLRGTVAMALSGVDTADPLSFSDAAAADPAGCALRERVRIELGGGVPDKHSELEVLFRDGRRLTERARSVPENGDLEGQWQRLSAKALRLASRTLGEERAHALVALLRNLDSTVSLDDLLSAARP